LRQEQLPQPEDGGEELEPEGAVDKAGSTSELCLSNQLYIERSIASSGRVWFD
jgi:hypothetical protein